MEEKVENFILFYKEQDEESRVRIRECFLEKTGLSYPSWYSKISRKAFSRLEMEALSNICQKDF